MEWKELVRRRYSCRSYEDKAVPDEIVREILDEARVAPSAGNKQPWLFYVVRDPKTKRSLREAYDKDWFYTAPVVIVACGDSEGAWKRSCDGKASLDIDVAIAVDHLTLAATDRGLGTCWICAFEPDAVRKHLSLPASVEPIVLTPLGYPADEPKPKKRKPIGEIVRFL